LDDFLSSLSITNIERPFPSAKKGRSDTVRNSDAAAQGLQKNNKFHNYCNGSKCCSEFPNRVGVLWLANVMQVDVLFSHTSNESDKLWLSFQWMRQGSNMIVCTHSIFRGSKLAVVTTSLCQCAIVDNSTKALDLAHQRLNKSEKNNCSVARRKKFN
jgi:hypothetical protein